MPRYESFKGNFVKDNNSPLLMVTYFFGNQGCCPAEWADDKVNALCNSDRPVVLLTSIFSNTYQNNNVKHFKVPSLSLIDIQHELSELKKDNRSIPYLQLIIFSPFILVIGLLLDLMQKVVTSGNGGGKWSWTIPAGFAALYFSFRYRCSTVFTTGGPASAHLAGCFIKLFSNKKLICELQDPLTGKDIGRNSRSAKMLEWVEKIIIKTANKVVYVTKEAAEYAKGKYPKAKAEIVAIYPGARQFDNSLKTDSTFKKEELTLIHLGTLYSTRNLNTIIEAIDELIDDGLIKEGQIKIYNLGEIYGDIKEHHLAKNYVTQKAVLPRQEAIAVAKSHMVSLLVQHADSRSNATIPYKTYDYFNIGNPILGLTNSDELFELLSINNHVPVNVSDVKEIKTMLLGLLENYEAYKARVSPFAIDIKKQLQEILV